MDFVGASQYDLEHSTDSEGIVTFTFTSVVEEETRTLEIKMEDYKVRAIFESFSEIAKIFHPSDINTTWRRRTLVDVLAGTATTELTVPV